MNMNIYIYIYILKLILSQTSISTALLLEGNTQPKTHHRPLSYLIVNYDPMTALAPGLSITVYS